MGTDEPDRSFAFSFDNVTWHGNYGTRKEAMVAGALLTKGKKGDFVKVFTAERVHYGKPIENIINDQLRESVRLINLYLSRTVGNFQPLELHWDDFSLISKDLVVRLFTNSPNKPCDFINQETHRIQK